ncbi:conserved hypothetical protein [Rhodococcus jostii RHA1]|uniref:DUF222 domain-containing protein n=2 Tax=Rhodococcus jostii TaxID=132919 RepID=Q0S337_RHOJR|nr:conserved hypothetical protein [Rhodococcus jostii RHA1]
MRSTTRLGERVGGAQYYSNMSSTGGLASDQVREHLTALDDAVSGLLDADLSAVSDSDVVLIMQQLEKSVRRAGAVSLRLIVESAERSLPATLGFNSPNKLLVEVLRVSAADASARVAAARDLGLFHTTSGEQMEAALPETASAQRDGDIGADHARVIRKIMRKIPHAVTNADVASAESILAQCARGGTPEDVESAGHRLLAHLDPDGNLGDDRDRFRRRGVSLGRQDSESGILGRHRGLPVTVIVTTTLDQLEKDAGGVTTTASGGLLPLGDALKLAERAHPVLVLFDPTAGPCIWDGADEWRARTNAALSSAPKADAHDLVARRPRPACARCTTCWSGATADPPTSTH